ncbi:site-specific DNA-methyltransferase (adenine-specific) [Agrobacterium vitis]|nr:site-specific DNA-methyltransferase (adenine-specific) [Agrobacterium vitis]MBE1437059.1 site-specific DNA-methyltransferase (adenine-specific) [Agrobacterium vitis]
MTALTLSESCTIWQGDCLDLWAAVLDCGKADHIISDPPYEAIIHAAKKVDAARTLRVDGGAELKSLDFDGIDPIRDRVAGLIAQTCTGWSLVFCSPEGVGRWADAFNATPARYKRACVWVKPDSTPQLNGQGPAMGAENFVAVWCGSGFSRWNGGGKRGVYTYPTNPRDRDGRHPTEKPLRLMAQLIADFTQAGDLVFDPFMGSGSTGVAALKMGRRFVGIEKDAAYFAVAADRLRRVLAEPGFDLGIPAPRKTVLQDRMEF